MNELRREYKLIDDYHKNLTNLLSAIQDAGGSVNMLKGDMSVRELLISCARNNIEINAKFVKQKKKNHTVPDGINVIYE